MSECEAVGKRTARLMRRARGRYCACSSPGQPDLAQGGVQYVRERRQNASGEPWTRWIEERLHMLVQLAKTLQALPEDRVTREIRREFLEDRRFR